MLSASRRDRAGSLRLSQRQTFRRFDDQCDFFRFRRGAAMAGETHGEHVTEQSNAHHRDCEESSGMKKLEVEY